MRNMPPPQLLWYKEILNYLISQQTPSVKPSQYKPSTVLAVCGMLKDQRQIWGRG